MDPTATRDLAALPKAHLHLHFEASMRPATLADLAAAAGIDVPTVRGFGSFTAFADMYVAACDVLRSEDDLRRLVDEAVDDAAADGAVWIEPAIYLPRHAERFGSSEHVLEVLIDAGARAAVRCGVGVGWIVAADRTVDPAEAVEQAELAARYTDRTVVGFGLANDEARWPPEPFAEAFAIARDAGLLSAPHAGELAGPGSITGALDTLGADRLQHGVRAIEDPALVSRLADSGICLDVCPSSNILLSVYPSLADHPLPALLDAGVRCSVNADDPLLFGPGLLDEYEICRTDMALSDEVLATVARSSVECSGAPDDRKAAAVADIETWLASSAV